jgi:hypothetical protein
MKKILTFMGKVLWWCFLGASAGFLKVLWDVLSSR